MLSSAVSSPPAAVSLGTALAAIDARDPTERETIALLSDEDLFAYADACGWPRPMSVLLRRKIRQGLGMPADSTAVSAASASVGGVHVGTARSDEVAALKARLAEAEKAAAISTATRLKAAEADRAAEATYKDLTLLRTAVRGVTRDHVNNVVAGLHMRGTMQVCFVMDGTGSMSKYFESVKAELVGIAASLANGTNAAARFGLVVYRDYDDGPRRCEVFPFTTAADLSDILGRVKCDGGADACEDCFGGLQRAMSEGMGWNTPARLVIWVGDAPNHGVRYNGGIQDDHPHAALEVDGPMLGRAAAELGIETVFLKLNTYTDRMTEVLSAEFASAGSVFRVGDGAELAKTILTQMTATAMGTHARVAAPAGGGGGRLMRGCGPAAKEFPLVVIPPKSASFAAAVECVVYTAQSCPKTDRAHSFDMLLARFPPCHEETRSIQTSTAPFAKGEMRYAFYARVSKSKRSWFAGWKSDYYVAKTPIRHGSSLGKAQVHMQTIARFLSKEFNARVLAYDARAKALVYVPVQLARMGADDWWMLEPYVEGTYLKFNNNNGSVNNALVAANPLPQAFSHFTYEYTRGALLVCDIQGVIDTDRYSLTDPAIHTLEPRTVLPDATNLGFEGMAAFFLSHICNDHCRRLGLPNRGGGGGSSPMVPPSISMSTLTSRASTESIAAMDVLDKHDDYL